MNPTAPGRAVRQHSRLLLQVPRREAYLYLEDLRDLLIGALEPDIEILDWRGADLGRAYLSHDNRRLLIGFRGSGEGPIVERYQMWLSHARNLLRGQRTEAPVWVVACPGDPTRPAYYSPCRGAMS